MKRQFWPSLLAVLVLAALAAMSIDSTAQFAGGMTSVSSEADGDSASVANLNTNVPWTRNSDRQTFNYIDSLAAWVGECVTMVFDRRANAVSGLIRFGANGVDCDTTSGLENGGYAHGDMEPFRMAATSTLAPSCSILVRADRDTILFKPWTSAQQMWFLSPADSAEKLLADSGTVVTVELKTAVTAPNNPVVTLSMRERVE